MFVMKSGDQRHYKSITVFLGIIMVFVASSFAFNCAPIIRKFPPYIYHSSRISTGIASGFLKRTFNIRPQHFSATEFSSSTEIQSQENDDILNEVAQNLNTVRAAVSEAEAKAGRSNGSVRLIAVSKTKPNEALQAAYNAGQRYFGENYVQEIIAKSPVLADDIKWHFIGPIQSNKAKQLVKGVPNLEVVETVSSAKIANRLNQGCAEINREQLKVFLQIDTSGEETKSGIAKEESLELAKHIASECPHLKLAGVMTIGKYGDMTCFDRLVESRNYICSSLNIDKDSLELSMGMSSDFEEAIMRGSTNVRVGTTIFGERDYSKKK